VLRRKVLGHTVRLMPPAYVRPYVKRQKNDAADAEAICEAVTRANMRFVPTKTLEQQSCLMLHRTRHLFIRQQTAVINAIRAHLADQPDSIPVLYCEPYPDNEAAIQRALRLRDQPNFANAWILEEDENVIWNSSELLLECHRRRGHAAV
jgi:hypothetical protein